jgi:hypothetical protein
VRAVGVLAGVVIIGVAAAIVMRAVERSGGPGRPLVATTLPGPPDGGAESGGPAPVRAAEAAACAAQAEAIRRALATHQALHGIYTDLAGLVAAGLLTEVPAGWSVHSDDGWATYRLSPAAGCGR